jgi:ABC-type amino acid transport substrate-binding protein
MKTVIRLLVLIPCLLHADELPPLRVAILSFAAPYVMQGNNQQFYGFDISMMTYVCKTLHRKCEYTPMSLKQIYTAILNKQVDLGVNTIIISADKMQYIEMSMPYMLSNGQFIGATELAQQPFSHQLLDNHRIGVIANSSFETYLRTLPIHNPRVLTFDSTDQIIDALRNNRIQFGFLDSHIVQYWQNNSSGFLHGLGEPFPVGNGLGIVANIDNHALIQEVNHALVEYQSSGQFKQDYQLYLENF